MSPVGSNIWPTRRQAGRSAKGKEKEWKSCWRLVQTIHTLVCLLNFDIRINTFRIPPLNMCYTGEFIQPWTRSLIRPLCVSDTKQHLSEPKQMFSIVPGQCGREQEGSCVVQ